MMAATPKTGAVAPPDDGILAKVARQLTDWRLFLGATLLVFLLLLSITYHWYENRITLTIGTEALLMRVQEEADLRPSVDTPALNGPFLIAGAAAIDGLPSQLEPVMGKGADVSGEGLIRISAIHLPAGS